MVELILAAALVLYCSLSGFLYYKMGSEGRFFLWKSFSGGGIFLGMRPTGECFLRGIKTKGRSLIYGKNGFTFMPSLLEDPQTEKEKRFNELIKRKAWLAGKPLFIGTTAACIAVNPHLAQATATAQMGETAETNKLLVNLKEQLPDNVKEINVVYPWDINTLSEYVNISYTEQDIDEAKQEGYIVGLKVAKRMNMALVGMVVAAIAGMVLIVFWLGR